MHAFARCLFGLALGLGAWPAGAATLALDFESLASGELVTTQFQAQGVVFANAVTLVAGDTLNQVDYPPSSGTRVVSGLGLGSIEIALAVPANRVRLQLTTSDTALVNFYDAADVLLDQLAVAQNLGSHTGVAFAAAGQIARVSIGDQLAGNAFGLVVDDLEVDTPEPAGVIAAGAGLAALAAARRRGRAG